MYILELTNEERTFLKESLQWARAGFEEKAGKYLGGRMAVEGYYENHYKPKMEQFKDMQSKLNLINLKEK